MESAFDTSRRRPMVFRLVALGRRPGAHISLGGPACVLRGVARNHWRHLNRRGASLRMVSSRHAGWERFSACGSCGKTSTGSGSEHGTWHRLPQFKTAAHAALGSSYSHGDRRSWCWPVPMKVRCEQWALTAAFSKRPKAGAADLYVQPGLRPAAQPRALSKETDEIHEIPCTRERLYCHST